MQGILHRIGGSSGGIGVSGGKTVFQAGTLHLDANGWAINGRLRINVAFGGSLPRVVCLPAEASRSLDDPIADRKTPG